MATSESISIRLPRATIASIERQAAEAGLTVGAFLRARLTVQFAPHWQAQPEPTTLACDEDVEHVHNFKAALFGRRRCECDALEPVV